jgi:Uma2 family endonuclease
VPRDVLEVPNPTIVVEVLSPGTERLDLSLKLEGYFTVPSLHHYLIIDPDRPILIHHRRGQGDAIETRFVHGSALRLDPPGLDVDLGEVLARP